MKLYIYGTRSNSSVASFTTLSYGAFMILCMTLDNNVDIVDR